jgi:hypothetical protein
MIAHDCFNMSLFRMCCDGLFFSSSSGRPTRAAAATADKAPVSPKGKTEPAAAAAAAEPAAAAVTPSTPSSRRRAPAAAAAAAASPVHVAAPAAAAAAAAAASSSSAPVVVHHPRVVVTGIDAASVLGAGWEKALHKLGGDLIDDVHDKPTHLVTDKVRRTEKFLTAFSTTPVRRQTTTGRSGLRIEWSSDL